MFSRPEPPVTAFATNRPRGWFPLKPVPDTHIQESRRLILGASDQVASGRAVILGGGRCQEIPLAELAGRFRQVTLNDMHESLLKHALAEAGLDQERTAKIQLRVADLTGLTDSFVRRLKESLNEVQDPAAAAQRFADVAEGARPIRLSGEDCGDLVIASCVLSQLHVVASDQALQLFAARFPGQEHVLRRSEEWVRSLYNLARRMEDTFIDGLIGLTARGGRIYLSDTVHLFFVEAMPQGQWVTEGSYRMTRTTQMIDYLDDRFQVEEQAQWAWIAVPPQLPDQVGRLYTVQGLVLSIR